jgi:HYDIN/CFA65/VesB-like, Ig-like domain
MNNRLHHGISAVLLPLAVLQCVASTYASDPLVSLSASELKFGTQALGTSSSPQMIVLTNIGQADLTITSISIGGENSADFAETTNCPMAPAVLAASTSCTVRLVFHPRTNATELTATLVISDNAAGSPRNVTLRGVPSAEVPGVTLSPDNVGFGNQMVGAPSAARAIVLTNSGSAVLNINSAISLSGADAGEFRLARSTSPCPESSGQVAVRASCEIDVVFAPTTAGGKSAEVVIVDDAAGSPHVITMSGTAVAP